MAKLTRCLPKPLLSAGDKPLIVHQVEKLARAGYREIVVNHAYLGEKIEASLGDGSRFGVRIRYSREVTPLETAGGILQAMPLLGKETFIVVNADIWTDYAYEHLPVLAQKTFLAHLVLVENPEHNSAGDFTLTENGRVALPGKVQPGCSTLTYSGIAVFRPDFFAGLTPGYLPLKPLLDEAVSAGKVSGELHRGVWMDAGTPERLHELDQFLRRRPD